MLEFGVIPPWAKLAGAAACVTLAFSAGWSVNGWRLEAEHRVETAAAMRVLRDRSLERDALAAKLQASEDAHLTKMKEAQDETNKLRDCLRDGTCGLRIAARCPRLPKASANTDLGPGAFAELDPFAQRAYFALRDGIDRVSAQLAACQAELRLRQ